MPFWNGIFTGGLSDWTSLTVPLPNAQAQWASLQGISCRSLEDSKAGGGAGGTAGMSLASVSSMHLAVTGPLVRPFHSENTPGRLLFPRAFTRIKIKHNKTQFSPPSGSTDSGGEDRF